MLQIKDMLKWFAESQAIDFRQSQNVKSFIQVGEQFHTQVMPLILIWLVTIVTTSHPEVGTSALHLLNGVIKFLCLPELVSCYTQVSFKIPLFATAQNIFTKSLQTCFGQMKHCSMFCFT